MGRIVHLNQNMINMIAAGEVIERPASVVKELMENSIDAGATAITITAEDGGRRLLAITDNGCGMDADDLDAAFEAHATSKIKDTEDLNAIATLGFRGEALASIASIALVRAVSRTPESNQANCIEIDCGQRKPVSPCSGDVGTTIQIRDIFYKTPARRKFLRTANTEMSHVTEQFTRIALAQLQLDLTLVHNGKELHRLTRGQDQKERIAKLFPMIPPERLVETENHEKGIRIRALLGHPSISRTNNKFQYTFLNGRFIRDKFISHAIKEAYRGLLEPNRFPVTFLFIEIPYSDYDVNVHPTKTEVRFYNANLVHSQILAAMREKLLGIDLQMPAQLPMNEAPSGAARRQEIADAMTDFFKTHRPAHHQGSLDFRSSRPAAPFTLTSRAPLPCPVGPEPNAEPPLSSPQPEQDERKYFQIHDSYIIEETDEGFVIIDQHALHESMMYETLRLRVQSRGLESQRLLLPEQFDVTEVQAGALAEHAEMIAKLGIELTPFGPKTYAVQTFPVLLERKQVQPVPFIQDLIDILVEKRGDSNAEDMLDDVLNMTACKAAIKAGQKLSNEEIRQLLDDRRLYESISRCPHGRPTTIKFTKSELEKQFKRT